MSVLHLIVAVSCCLLALLSVATSQTPPTCSSTVSSVPVPAAWFDLSFVDNPTTAASSFTWTLADSGDSLANQGFHTGLVNLAGYNNVSYINMSSTSGPYFGGKTLPSQNIGGPSAGSLTSGTFGWSFEVTFKATAQITWGKIFDIGNSNNNGCNDDIALSWNSNTFGFQGDYCTSGKPATPNTPAVGGAESAFYPQYQIPVGQWQHAILVFQNILQPDGKASLSANYLLYINGQMAPSQGWSGTYPTAVYRANADIGKSDWADGYWSGFIDQFAIYNWALQGDQALALYQNRMAGCTLTSGNSVSTYPGAPSQATGALTAKYSIHSTVDPTPNCGGTCAYGYLASGDQDDFSCGLNTYHTGLLNLYGSQTPTSYQPYVNLSATSGPNSISSTPMPTIGGASIGSLAAGTYGWSFEVLFKPRIVETWAKLMDISQPQTSDGHCHHDIIFGWVYDGPIMSFSTCDADNYQYSIDVIPSTPIFTWTHAVLVVQQDATSPTSAYYYSYINGQLTNNKAGQWYIAGVPRSNAFIGRSEWAADYFWNGLIDVLNVYDVAISGPQALQLFKDRTNNGAAATACQVGSGNTAVTIDASWKVFEADFLSDPRSAAGATPNYGWSDVDSNDTVTDKAQHKGLLYLAGGNAAGTGAIGGNYVNLSAPTGTPQSIGGSPLPELLIGAITPGTSPINGTAGWAFEVVFKATGQQPWAKVFDIGNFQPNSNQQCSEDIVFGWVGNNANQMGFQVCDQSNNAQGPQPAFSTTILNTWHHVIANIILQRNGLAVYQVWLDGVLQTSSSFTTWIWPQYVQRTNANLGRSNWNDNYWQGYIDYFAIYNRALDTAQIQNRYYTNMLSQSSPAGVQCDSSLSSVSVPAPWYQIFDTNPSAAVGSSNASYTWLQSDSIDNLNGQSQYHTGLLVLAGGPAGTTGPYINLSSPTGTPNSIGTPLPGYIGGDTSNGGDITKGTYGWSFEVTFKPTSQQTWAKLFDIGNPQVAGICRDDLLFGWVGATQAFSFTYCDGTGFQYTAFPSFTAVLNTWYHVVISIQRLQDTDGSNSNTANYFVYINGQQLAGSGAGGPYPTAVNRANADIGRSDWADAYFGGQIDTFAIYNSALTQKQAQALYQKANGGCSLSRASSTANSATLEWLTPSRVTAAVRDPVYSLSGSTDPRTQSSVQYAYDWASSDTYDQACGLNNYRSGLLVLKGLEQQGSTSGPFINLSASTGPNSVGAVMPNIGGTSSGAQSTLGGGATGTAGWSIEFMVKPTKSETWAKLFDFGQPQTADGHCHDDIISGWYNQGPYWSFSTCDPDNVQYAINNAVGRVYLDAWSHVVLVIQQSPSNSSWANYFSYINGRLYGAYATAWYPRSVYRANALIGRSDWVSDFYWAGEIDFFRIYDVAISAPQALALYNTATNNGQLQIDCAQWALKDTSSTIDQSWLIFEELFTDDPRLRAGGPGTAAALYGWSAFGANDSVALNQYHKGVLTLAGADNGDVNAQYVNLTASSGVHSIVKTLDTSFIGGLGSGYALAETAGFSIEIVFKPTAARTWGKLLDFGTPGVSCDYDIVFGWQASSATAMTWSACDQFGTEYPTDSNARVATSSIQVGQWHHMVLIVEEMPSGGTGEFEAYLNGVMVMNNTDNYYPHNVRRPNADIGRSDWADSFWQGEVDSIRIYNRVLNKYQVGALYSQATGEASPAGSASSGGGSSLSGGAIAGIVIGSVVGAAILLVILFFVCCAATRGKKSTDDGHNSRGAGKFGEMENSRNVEMSHVGEGEQTA